jgi:hydroxyethylthiazole kinase-like uncharacterized protein yjeF
VTVTMHGRKVGLEIAPGRFEAGEVVVADIGLEPRQTEHRLVTREILDLVPRKREQDNKYSAGAVLVVGGAPGMTGAVSLAATAAFRADAGYVTVCVPPESLPVVEGRLVEAVKRPLDEVFDAVPRHRSLALGPGLGRQPGRQELARRLLEATALPAVVDADGLFGLEPFERPAPTVLTPHAGELARLLDRDSDWVGAHRLEAVGIAKDRFGCICLLKGADTIVARRGTSRVPPRAPDARDGRHGRRTHGRDRRISREGRRGAARGGGRGGRLRRRGRTRPGPRARRLRRRLSPAPGAGRESGP